MTFMFRARLRPFSFPKPRYPTHTRPFSRASGSNNNALGLTRRTAARVTVLTASSIFLASTIYADSNVELSTRPSFGSLVRAYAVFSICSVPSLVDASPKILATLSSIPGVRQITEAFVRVTFFDQFVGADTAEGAIPLLRSLRAANQGVLFAYSVEVDENEAIADALPYKRIVDEMLHCIDIAADFEASLAGKTVADGPHGRRTWVAVKMTALLPDAHALIALSSHITASRKALPSSSREAMVPFPGSAIIEDLDIILKSPSSDHSPLTPSQILSIRELYADLVRICTRATEKGVKLILDAEYSWYQPAIDALTLALMREFNSLKPTQGAGEVQPLIYQTFQCYYRRTPAQLALALEDARRNNYALGAKLVRGAYHPHELEAHKAGIEFDNTPHAVDVSRPSPSISPEPEPPVWTEKKDTDDTYNRCAAVLIKAVKDDVDRCAGRAARKADEVVGIDERKGWFTGLFGWTKDAMDTATSPVKEQMPSVPGIGVLFGTHNWDSSALVLKELVRNGLAVEDTRIEQGIKVRNETVERIAIGQLYGMTDDLTEWIVSRINSSTPFVIKYVPYGGLAQVMPYLCRRAIENKSVLGEGAAEHERQRAGQEIWKRILG
ncbi:FAD-linked oxidoreductase-like protein [Flammula alnicola]|nr:FAD-linked oxidoreductase-like protein [Flammula alnicola]